jgi:transposase-like protein
MNNLRATNMTPEQIDALLLERRQGLAERAARIYGENHSLRMTAELMNVSHETVRSLLREAGVDRDGKHGPRTEATDET